MQTKMVSLITPCYNSENYIHRLLDSVLSQLYPKIEMIIIDDGSTDKSSSIIKSYIPLFEVRGYTLQYVYQENSGQSVAISKGLELITGDYVAWPDSDDFYSCSSAISKMVERLETKPLNYTIVRTMVRVVDENTLKELFLCGEDYKENEENLFEDCLLANQFSFTAGAYLVRVEALNTVLKEKIYTEKNAGQNWQLLLPILYCGKCTSIKEILYTIVERQGSHSRGAYWGYEKEFLRLNVYERTVNNTLSRIDGISNEQLEYYQVKVKNKYLIERLHLAYRYRKKREFLKQYGHLNKCDITLRENLQAIAVYLRQENTLDVLYQVYLKIRYEYPKRIRCFLKGNNHKVTSNSI